MGHWGYLGAFAHEILGLKAVPALTAQSQSAIIPVNIEPLYLTQIDELGAFCYMNLKVMGVCYESM